MKEQKTAKSLGKRKEVEDSELESWKLAMVVVVVVKRATPRLANGTPEWRSETSELKLNAADTSRDGNNTGPLRLRARGIFPRDSDKGREINIVRDRTDLEQTWS